MDKFELYMIDNLKKFADKFREEEEKEIMWMEKCVLGELIEVFIKYEAYINCITAEYDYREENEELNQEVLIDTRKVS